MAVVAGEFETVALVEAAGGDIVRLGLETDPRQAPFPRPGHCPVHEGPRDAGAARVAVDGDIVDFGKAVPGLRERDVTGEPAVETCCEEGGIRLGRRLHKLVRVGSIGLDVALDRGDVAETGAGEGWQRLGRDLEGEVAAGKVADETSVGRRDDDCCCHGICLLKPPQASAGRSLGSNWMMVCQVAVSAGLRSPSISTLTS